jgi:hypothetical protein
MGDERPAPIEYEAATERDLADPGPGGPGRRVSTTRVVRGPGRRSRLVVIVAALAVVTGGLSWWATSGDPGDGPPFAAAVDNRPTRVAFHEAIYRLGQAGSFAYEGDVRAAEQSSFRPGDATARAVAVEGAVLMPHDLTRDVAVDATGRAVETVTSGPTTWTRSASTVAELGDEPWAFRTTRGAQSLGMGAVVNVILSATDPWEATRDSSGRRRIHATLPPADPRDGYGDLLAGAELVLTLDVDGDIARFAVESAQNDPDLVLELDIMRLGEPQEIAFPKDGGASLRSAVPVDELEAAGVRPVELGRVPERWQLTSAWAMPAPAGPAGCLHLNLSYRGAEAVYDGFITLRVTAPACGWIGQEDGEPEPLTAGSFEGTVLEAASVTTGDLLDGTTRVGFVTDLSAEDAATVLASLRPFDPEREPTSLAGLPSD